MKLHQAVLSVIVLFAMAATGVASAKTILGLNLNNDAARVIYMTPITSSGLYANASYIYNRDRGDIINAGIHLVGDAGVGPNPLHAGLGAQLYYVHPNIPGPAGSPNPGNLDGAEAVAVGGFIQYQLPFYNRIGFSGHVYYAPDVVAFNGLSHLIEYGARVSYQVLRSATVYVGFRQVKASYGSADYDLDSGFHLGMQFKF